MQLIERYESMVLMRRFEEVCAAGAESGEIHGELHLAVGHEGIAGGMLGVLREDDALVSTHRAHQHALAKGVPVEPLLAEIFERETGLCGGFGGHMHLFSPAHRFSCTGIVGASLPVALGHAYGAVADDRDSVAVGVTGDGGTSTGAFHESLNLAAAWSLPLVILVENNHYAISVPAASAVAGPGIAARAIAYGAIGLEVDGADVEAFNETFERAVDLARRREGVVLLEAHCERFRGHYEGDLDHYRSAAEKEAMLARDPLRIARDRLLGRGVAAAEVREREEAAGAVVEAAIAAVRAAPPPAPERARENVFAGGIGG